jgi:hypothetical protein
MGHRGEPRKMVNVRCPHIPEREICCLELGNVPSVPEFEFEFKKT